MIKSFDEIFEDVTKKGTKIKTDEYLKQGLYPIIDQGQSQISGYSNSEQGLFRDVPAIIFGDHTRIIKYVDEPFFMGADGIKVLRCKLPNANYKYLFYALQSVKIPNTGYNRHFKWLKEAQIAYPSDNIQKRVVSVLDSLQAIIAHRRQQLAKLDELVKARFVEMFGDYDLSHPQESWVSIKEISDVVGGATPKTNIEEYWNGTYRWITPAEIDADSGYIYDSVRKLTKAGVESCSLQEMPIGTVILSSRAPIGKLAIAGNTFYCNQGFKNIICKENVIPRYLYTLLLFNVDFLNSLGRGATFKEISKGIVENIRIPLPPIALQNQFAAYVTQTEKIKSAIQKSLDKTQLLFDSLMQEYFG